MWKRVLRSGDFWIIYGILVSLIFFFSPPKYIALAIVFPALGLAYLRLNEQIVPFRRLDTGYFSHLSCNWQFHNTGCFSGTYTYTFVNKGKLDIQILPHLAIAKQATDLNIEFHYETEKAGHSIFSISELAVANEKVRTTLAGEESNLLTWTPIVSPPIPPGESISFRLNVKTNGADNSIFETNGQEIGIAAPVYIENAELFCTCEPTKSFEVLRNPKVVSLDQQRVLKRPFRVSLGEPRTQGNTLQWSMNRLYPHRRYWIRTRIV